jgi:hypothetical protein
MMDPRPPAEVAAYAAWGAACYTAFVLAVPALVVGAAGLAVAEWLNPSMFEVPE